MSVSLLLTQTHQLQLDHTQLRRVTLQETDDPVILQIQKSVHIIYHGHTENMCCTQCSSADLFLFPPLNSL